MTPSPTPVTPITTPVATSTPGTPSYTVSSFANSIRTKFPTGVASDGTPYAKMPDSALVQKIVAKYPTYASQIKDYQAAPTPTPAPAKPSALDNVASDISDAGSKVNADVTDTSTNPLEAGVRAASDAATAIPNVVADVIPGGKAALGAVNDVAGAAIKAPGDVGGVLADLSTKLHLMSPEQRAAYDKANADFANSDAGNTITKLATDLAAGGNVAGTILGAGQGADALEGGLSKVKAGAATAKDTVTNALKPDPEAQTAAQAAKDAAAQQLKTQAGIKDATPDYESMSPNQKGSLRSQPAVNGNPRVTENTGLTGKRGVTPNDLETKAGTELASTPGYEPKMTALEKYNLGKAQLSKLGQETEDSLGKENILVPPKEALKVVTDAINKVSENSLLLSKADPAIRNYTRVVKNALAQAPGTLKGLLAVRKAIDAAYENARGRMAYGSDRLASIDEIHTAGRDALNQYLIDHARNTPVEALLQRQFHLYRALDEVGNKADREGSSVLSRTMQQHPVATEIVKSVGRAAGVGGAINGVSHL